MKNKLILGSANFEQKYGIKKNFIKKKEIKKLFKLALKNNINKIDTSPLYNSSEKIIGSLKNNRFGIISKVPKIPENVKKKNIKKWLERKTMNSIKNLKIKKLDALLLQNSNSLLGKNGNEIYKSLKDMKIKGLTRKIGISIYDFNTLKEIIKKFKLDLIQAPFNVLDRRLVSKGWLRKLKKNKIEIHVRSIFLQGILLLKYKELPKKLNKHKNNWMIWENWLKKNNLDSLSACVRFVLQHKQLDGIVIGCNSSNHLSQILNLKQTKSNFSFPNLNVKNKKLIDPRQWLN